MSTTSTQSRWLIDASHSLLEFSVKHMMIATVKGRFKIEGTIDANLPDLTTAKIEVSADVASIDTREAQRDQHLLSPDFLDAESHPKITFASLQIQRSGDDQYQLTGDLTIHGVTREVTFDVTFEGMGKDPWGNQRAGFSAEARINRKDFGLQWNVALETGGVLVGEQVKISVQVEATKQA